MISVCTFMHDVTKTVNVLEAAYSSERKFAERETQQRGKTWEN